MSQNQQSALSPEIQLGTPWHTLQADETLEKLGVSLQDGLSSEEVARRHEIYGLNQLAEKPRPTFLKRLLDQLNDFLVILLIVAAVVSGLLGDEVEAAAIMAIVILNAILGLVQEGRAEEALAALKKMAAPEALVLRDGHRKNIPASQLAPGDIVFLEGGNFIPADLRLIQTFNLRIDEAALTGESVARQKHADTQMEEDSSLGDRKNTAYLGTTVIYGRGQGVVANTGMQTELGKIAGMLQSVEEGETPLQRRLDDLGKVLGIASLAIVGLVFLIGAVRVILNSNGAYFTPETLEAIKTSFMIAVSLAIAAVPEGLAAVVTISLALGMREMVQRHALIRRLASVETLGSATTICSDKTGTLTQNEMTIRRCWTDNTFFEVTGTGYVPEGDFKQDGKTIDIASYPALGTTIWIGALNNDAYLDIIQNGNDKPTYRIIGDPTEGSLIVAAEKIGVSLDGLNKAYPRTHEIPFDSTRKRMLTVHNIEDPRTVDPSPYSDGQNKGQYVVAVKGAPDIVLEFCTQYQTMDNGLAPLDNAARQRILEANDTLTKDALRVLGMAYYLTPSIPTETSLETLEQDLVFVGLSGMIDPARPEVTPALEHASKAGIRTIMITGDYPNTARAIAEDIKLLQPGNLVLTGKQVDKMDDVTLQQEVLHTDVFARVSPEHKMRIVDALKASDEVVAMTGDGVNDAPAIKSADIGVAMGITGTDVAKETADMVLTDDNYASIVSAIEQGRIIYSNIRKFVYYLLSCNLAEIAVIFLATLFNWPTPLTALQLLWLNLLTDGAPALALATEKGDPDIMDQAPRPPKEPIINRNMQVGIVVQTIAITSVTMAAYFIGLSDPDHHLYAQTMAFVTLSASELFRAYTARSEYYPLLKIGILKNKWMNYAVLASLGLILLVLYVPFLQGPFQTEPLGWLQWVEIIPLLLFPSVAAEVTKYFLGKKHRNANAS
jgi:P-type Ca2+ transporter type 2C